MIQFKGIIDFTTKAWHSCSTVAHRFDYAMNFFLNEHTSVINNRIQWFNLWAWRSVFVCALTLRRRRSQFKLLGVLLRHSLRKCPIFPHLKHALHSFEAWFSRLQCLQGPSELFWVLLGRLGVYFRRLGPRRLLSRPLLFLLSFELFWKRTVRVPCELVLFDREGWLRFGVLFGCRETSGFHLGMVFLNPSVSVRKSSSIHSLVGGSGVSREIAFTLASAILLADGAPFSISRKEFNSVARARATSAVAGLDFLSSHRSFASLRSSMKLVRTICSTKWGKAR